VASNTYIHDFTIQSLDVNKPNSGGCGIYMPDAYIVGPQTACGITSTWTGGYANAQDRVLIRNVSVWAAAQGILANSAFNIHIEDTGVGSKFNNAFEVGGDPGCTMLNTYAYDAGSGYAGYRLHGGCALIGANGVNGSNLNEDWGVCGDTVDEDGKLGYCRASIIGSNLEAFTRYGFRIKGGGAFFANDYFLGGPYPSANYPSSVTTNPVVDLMQGTATGITTGVDGATSFTTNIGVTSAIFMPLVKSINISGGTATLNFYSQSPSLQAGVSFYLSGLTARPTLNQENGAGPFVVATSGTGYITFSTGATATSGTVTETGEAFSASISTISTIGVTGCPGNCIATITFATNFQQAQYGATKTVAGITGTFASLNGTVSGQGYTANTMLVAWTGGSSNISPTAPACTGSCTLALTGYLTHTNQAACSNIVPAGTSSNPPSPCWDEGNTLPYNVPSPSVVSQGYGILGIDYAYATINNLRIGTNPGAGLVVSTDTNGDMAVAAAIPAGVGVTSTAAITQNNGVTSTAIGLNGSAAGTLYTNSMGGADAKITDCDEFSPYYTCRFVNDAATYAFPWMVAQRTTYLPTSLFLNVDTSATNLSTVALANPAVTPVGTPSNTGGNLSTNGTTYYFKYVLAQDYGGAHMTLPSAEGSATTGGTCASLTTCSISIAYTVTTGYAAGSVPQVYMYIATSAGTESTNCFIIPAGPTSPFVMTSTTYATCPAIPTVNNTGEMDIAGPMHLNGAAGTAGQVAVSGGSGPATYADLWMPVQFQMAAVNNTSGGLSVGNGVSLPTTNPATLSSHIGTYITDAYTSCAAGTTCNVVLQGIIPGDWDNTTYPYFKVNTLQIAATAANIVYNVQIACGATDDTAWMTALVPGTIATGSTNYSQYLKTAQFTSASWSLSNCVAGMPFNALVTQMSTSTVASGSQYITFTFARKTPGVGAAY
jgi:hypothetical protein